MKYCINEEVAHKNGLSLNEMLLIMLLKNTDSIQDLIDQMVEDKKLVFYQGNYRVFEKWDEKMQQTLLDSDKDVPQDDKLLNLVEELRALFPTGNKSPGVSWRSNVRELTTRLKKFFKIYGEKPYEDILKAAKTYVDSFNGNYAYMRTLKYFIIKDDVKLGEEGVRYVETISELSNILEGGNENNPSGNFDFGELK